jgi:hypothetical protein
MACDFIAKLFQQEAVGNARADVDLVIRRLPQDHEQLQDAAAAAPAAKRSRRESTSRAAAADDGEAADALQLAKFPAHNFILDNSEYFERQQVSWGCSAAHTVSGV